MEGTSARVLEEAPGRRDAPEEDAREQAEGGDGFRKASEAVALVSAGVLVGGGAGMLAGVTLGAINPYALGLLGVAAGTWTTVLLKGVTVARDAARRPWWRGGFGG